jgi:hypothetical protein
MIRITDEMSRHFRLRTESHINLVRKWAACIYGFDRRRFADLIYNVKTHDISKYREPEFTPYVFITWDYRCKAVGEAFEMPDEMRTWASEATLFHVTNNGHHPEFWSPVKIDLINREDRDQPPAKPVDATCMPDVCIAEMCADWFAMSDEKGGNPLHWAKKNIGIRWAFIEHQTRLIYNLCSEVWHAE